MLGFIIFVVFAYLVIVIGASALEGLSYLAEHIKLHFSD
jgi:hypothetical protein